MIERVLKHKLVEMTNKYPIVTLTGPRQSGKSTLLKTSFPDYKYVSLEDLDMRLFATDDPKGFLTFLKKWMKRYLRDLIRVSMIKT
jgi:predicted AAA+ superfamily ATPase